MLSFLLPILSFFAGNAKSFFKDSSEVITKQLALHLRAITFLIVTAIGSLTLSCVGISLFIVSLAKQLELEDGFVFSNSMIVYLVMSLISISVLIYSLKSKTWLEKLETEKPTPTPKASGAIENAVAVVVMDFIEERQRKRESSSHSSAATHGE